MFKSMSIHQKDSKGIVNSNFVASCFAFKVSIPTVRATTYSYKGQILSIRFFIFKFVKNLS